MNAGRQLKKHRRENRWADKDYKKSHLGNEWKKPFQGASHAKGIVLEKMCVPPVLLPLSLKHVDVGRLILACTRSGIEAKQPNSAIRKCARVQLIKNGKKIAAFVPNDGCLNFIEENVRPAPRATAACPPASVCGGPCLAGVQAAAVSSAAGLSLL